MAALAAVLALPIGALPCWQWMTGAALNLAAKGFAVRCRSAALESESRPNYGESRAISRHTVGNTAD